MQIYFLSAKKKLDPVSKMHCTILLAKDAGINRNLEETHLRTRAQSVSFPISCQQVQCKWCSRKVKND